MPASAARHRVPSASHRRVGNARPSLETEWPPIEEHGIIGDLHTACLVAPDGTLDWMCLPHFDSPSVFASLLDPAKGGRFTVRPRQEFRTRSLYRPHTNVLVTRFYTREGTAELVDFMPISPDGKGHRVVRILRVLRGRMDFLVECQPRPGYGQPCKAVRRTEGVQFMGDPPLLLRTRLRLGLGRGSAHGIVRLSAGEEEVFEFQDGTEPGGDPHAMLEETERFWREWASACTYKGRWREQVLRSALVLKLLTFEPTGAMVAAATTSLPGVPGGPRNWDYRYTWLRDSSFVLYALLRIGFRHEAKRFMDWAVSLCCNGPRLRPVYTVEGHAAPPERELPLRGYMDSRPVRVGNAATDHLQLDTYGAVLDAAYLFNKYGMPLSTELWEHLRGLLEWLEGHWQDADRSIWETRERDRRFTFSRVMCWVAFDRGIRLAERRSFPAPLERWRKVRDEIRAWVLENAWDDRLKAFVQAPGSRTLDASALLLPLTFFASPMDRAVASTLRAIQERLAPDGLVRRMEADSPADGFPGTDGSFTVCSFWLVEALTRQGRVAEARDLFEVLLRHGGRLGLYPEQVGDFGMGRGNFPQALTHLSFVSAAFNLDRALEEGTQPAGLSAGTAWRAFVEADLPEARR